MAKKENLFCKNSALILIAMLTFLGTDFLYADSNCRMTFDFQTDFNNPRPASLDIDPSELDRQVKCLEDEQLELSQRLQEKLRKRLEIIRRYLQRYRQLKMEEEMFEQRLTEHNQQIDWQKQLLEADVPSLAILVISRATYTIDDDRTELENNLSKSNVNAVTQHLARLTVISPAIASADLKMNSSAPILLLFERTAYLLDSIEVVSQEHLELSKKTIRIDNSLILGRQINWERFPEFRALSVYHSEINRQIGVIKKKNARMHRNKVERESRIKSTLNNLKAQQKELLYNLTRVQDEIAGIETQAETKEVEKTLLSTYGRISEEINRLISHPPVLVISEKRQYWETATIIANVKQMVAILWDKAIERLGNYPPDRFRIFVRKDNDERGIALKVLVVAAANLIDVRDQATAELSELTKQAEKAKKRL